MSSSNEQLEPTPFDVAQPGKPTPAARASAAQQATGRWVVPALGGLLLLAVVVFFWLPEQVTAPPPPGIATEGNASGIDAGAGPARAAPAVTDAAPWSDAQAAKLRKEAQDVLAALLDIQFELEERGVGQWAPEAFAAAAVLATAGDELYRQRQYVAAKTQYEQALAALQELHGTLDEELASQLDLARRALEDGDATGASSSLELAALIDPDTPEVEILERRLANLPQLLSLLAEAATAELGGDLATAEGLLAQAAALDEDHLRTRQELQRVTETHLVQRFNGAMSAGYSALDGGHFRKASEAFSNATQLRPGSGEAASALQEVAVAETASRLATLQTRGARHEQLEQWQEAVSAYEQALAVDGDVLYAQEGLQRSELRAQLDRQIRTALDQPERMQDVAVADATARLLRQAQSVTPRQQVLNRQIEELQVLLQQANTPVAVTLRSDQETEVIVHKVQRLGRFQERKLTLRPGTYTAVGTRTGYRDVRHSFTVNHGTEPAPVFIACTEPI